MIAEVLMRPATPQSSKRLNPWNQAFRDRPALPWRGTSTERNRFAFVAFPGGGVETL
jgi:hypothetical protein